MNVERIKQCIEMMQHAQNLDMCSYQNALSGNSAYAENIEQLHTCGNTACFAGYLALSPEFKSAGGIIDCGVPVFNGVAYHHAVAEYLGISVKLADAMVYGAWSNDDDENDDDENDDDDDEPEYLYPVAFDEVKPHHVIDVLNRILAGELA